YGILNHLEAGIRIIDGLDTGGQFVRAIQVGAVEFVVVCAIFVVKHHVKSVGKNGRDVGVKPDFERPQVGGTAVDVLLLRRAEGDIGAAAIGAPSVRARTDTEPRVREGDALVDFLFIGVYFRTRNGIANLPEVLDEFVSRVIRGESEKSGALILGDDIDD